jgi:hypothetical protein
VTPLRWVNEDLDTVLCAHSSPVNCFELSLFPRASVRGWGRTCLAVKLWYFGPPFFEGKMLAL